MRSSLVSRYLWDANSCKHISAMSRNLINKKIFLMLMATAMLISAWVLPTWLRQFQLIKGLFA